MTAFLNSTPPPPRYSLTQNLTTAWLRLGKAAVFGILAGLAVAAGLAFPGGDAAAQGYGGYTYTARVCQEYGQQPRYFNVRDGQAAYNGGNSDSGWLIVLERGAGNVVPAQYAFSSPQRSSGAGATAQAALNLALTNNHHRIFSGTGTNSYGLSPGEAIIAADGTRGFVERVGNSVVIDRNDDGQFTAADMAQGLLGGESYLWYWERRTLTQTVAPINYGGSYIRWAHTAWCN